MLYVQICERFYRDLPTIIGKIRNMMCSDISDAGMLALTHTYRVHHTQCTLLDYWWLLEITGDY